MENKIAPIYPVSNVPAGAPSYVVDSVKAQCNSALNQALTVKAEYIVGARNRAQCDELESLRRKLDGVKTHTDPFWFSWGFRTVTKAWEDAAQLALFREALARKDISHVTSGHPSFPGRYNYMVYVVNHSSPSGCHLLQSAAHDLPGVDIVLQASGRRTCQGGQRGDMANR